MSEQPSLHWMPGLIGGAGRDTVTPKLGGGGPEGAAARGYMVVAPLPEGLEEGEGEWGGEREEGEWWHRRGVSKSSSLRSVPLHHPSRRRSRPARPALPHR